MFIPMRKSSLLILAVSLSFLSCQNEKENKSEAADDLAGNPFMEESKLPYFAPDFTVIKNEHFRPAILEGMRQQEEAIKAIVENEEAPTFENTIVALEQSNALLTRASRVFYALSSSHTNDEIRDLQQELAPKLSEHSDAIYLNSELFNRIKEVHGKIDELDLDAESKRLLDYYHNNFVVAGADLNDADKEKLMQLNSEEASLTTEFGRIVLDAMQKGGIHIENEEELAGLSEAYIRSIKSEDGNGWYMPLVNTTQQPNLASLENRDTREKLFKASYMRADGSEFDTNDVIKRIAQVRAEKAALLGFNNYAEWKLQNTMAKGPEGVRKFFDSFIDASVAKADAEAKKIQAFMNASGQEGTLEPWDWDFYAEKVRKAEYDLDENQIKPYFQVEAVMEDGVLYAAERLFGITYKKRDDIPVYHEDVVVYELFEEDGSELGLFYADFYARPSKRGGAWMSNFVSQSKLDGTKPVIYNVCNITKPADGEPALMTFDNVITMFHEFGHAIHGFFADQQYRSLSGTSVARDFVEFPSQFFENWATHPEIISNYAKHYETGDIIPQELLDKIEAAGTFNQGYSAVENLASSNIDYEWHVIGADTKIEDATAFEAAALNKYNLDGVDAVKPRYRSTYFNHIFNGGYAAGYYSYLWTDMLNYDAYQWFVENGGLTRENGQRFRDMILSRGNTLDYDEMYKDFRGSNPSIEPMLKARGLM